MFDFLVWYDALPFALFWPLRSVSAVKLFYAIYLLLAPLTMLEKKAQFFITCILAPAHFLGALTILSQFYKIKEKKENDLVSLRPNLMTCDALIAPSKTINEVHYKVREPPRPSKAKSSHPGNRDIILHGVNVIVMYGLTDCYFTMLQFKTLRQPVRGDLDLYTLWFYYASGWIMFAGLIMLEQAAMLAHAIGNRFLFEYRYAPFHLKLFQSNPFFSVSPHEFWGKTWHQTFRSMFMVNAYHPTIKFVSRWNTSEVRQPICDSTHLCSLFKSSLQPCQSFY
jgi:hypothetical protein